MENFNNTSQSILTLLMIEDKQRSSEFNTMANAILPNLRLAQIQNDYNLEILEDALLECEEAFYQYSTGWTSIKEEYDQEKINSYFDNEAEIANEDSSLNNIAESTATLLLQSDIPYDSDEYRLNHLKIKKHLISVVVLSNFDLSYFNSSLLRTKPLLKAIN